MRTRVLVIILAVVAISTTAVIVLESNIFTSKPQTFTVTKYSSGVTFTGVLPTPYPIDKHTLLVNSSFGDSRHATLYLCNQAPCSGTGVAETLDITGASFTFDTGQSYTVTIGEAMFTIIK